MTDMETLNNRLEAQRQSIQTYQKIERELTQHIDRLESEESAKHRRLDCLRIAKGYLEHIGRDANNDIINTAILFASFVETGSTPAPTDPPPQ